MIRIDRDTIKKLATQAGFSISNDPFRATGGFGNFFVFLDAVEREVCPWQPIYTAPRDGTPIDVWSGGDRIPNVRWMRPDRCWREQPEKVPTWCAMEPYYDENHWHEIEPAPTHWMPLPVPPK